MMSCGAQKTITVRRAVHSDGSTTFHFLTFLRIYLRQWRSARVTVLLEGSSGLLTVSSAVIYANTEDGLTAASAVDFPGTPITRTADGISYGISFSALDVTYQIAEIGVQVKNTSGTKRQMGTVTITIDLSEE
jgi:hypothetical protein